MELESAKPDNNESLFFHQQRNPVRQYRRVRKEPEELPQALRYFKYANLNPRIAAYLGKQDPKNILKRAKGQGGAKPDGKEPGATAPPGGVIGGEFSNDLSREARSLLPDIEQGFNGMGMFADPNFDPSRLSFPGENEDPQRYQFEETTFAAPNILRELAEILNRFVVAFTNYAQRTTLYDPETDEPLLGDSISPSVLIPAGVKELLCQSWEDLTAEVVYAPRMWQSSSTRNALRYSTSLGGKTETTPIVANVSSKGLSGTAEKKSIGAGGLKSIADLLEEVQSKSRNKRESETIDPKALNDYKKKGKGKESTQISSLTPASTVDELNYISYIEPVKSESEHKVKLGYRRRKLANKLQDVSTVQWKVNQAVPHSKKDRDLSTNKSTQNINVEVTDDGLPISAPIQEVTKLYRYGGYPTISFNLSSRRAMDEGWIVTQQPETNIGEKNLLEWATNRLRMAMREKEYEDEEAQRNGATKPVFIRYYGDSRRDTLLKLYRKGAENEKSSMVIGIPGKKTGIVPKIPQLTKLESGQKDEFMVQLPDGSISVFYPKTTITAIVASAVPGEAGQLYVHCFNNDVERKLIASFTPYGKACCYHKNGDPGMILTEEGGVIKTETGTVQLKWLWPKNGGKLKDPVDFQLNKEMNVRVLGKYAVNLFFSSNRESVKIPVGAMQGVAVPQGLHKVSSAMLQSGFGLSLKAAVEYAQQNNRPDGKSRQKGRRDRLRRNLMPQNKKPSEIEALRQGLDPPERFEFDSQADRELHRLGVKTKHLVDDWMEHYRIALGMASPAIKRMLEKPKVRISDRKIQSAKERRLPPEEEEFEEKPSSYQSFRSPSAPPRHMLPGPHSLTVEDKRGIVKRSSPDKRSVDTPHVRIEEAPPPVVQSEPVIELYKPSAPETTSREVKTRPSTQAHYSPSRSHVIDRRKTISASAIVSGDSKKSRKMTYALLCDCCPVVTRAKLINAESDFPKMLTCKCSKHKVPFINDLELDYFLHRVAPVTQLIVVCVINSLHPKASPYDKMMDHIYIQRNKNRSQPCRQAKYDQYRIFYYDLAIAKAGTKRSAPLLLTRHNAVPGMALMYCGGRLLFADNIFNGYGNARNDFRKQIFKSRRDYSLGHFLPDDFRFTPQQGKSGPRAAWGGELGGAGVDGKGEPGLFFNDNSVTKSLRKGLQAKLRRTAIPTETTTSDVTSGSFSIKLPQSRSFDSARDFIQYSLSTSVYFGRSSKGLSETSNILTTRSAMERDISPSYVPVTYSAVA